MFHLDVTFEDQRIIANSPDGHQYKCTIYDALTGNNTEILFTAIELSYVLAMNLDPVNTLLAEEIIKMYNVLEPLIKHLPLELRPIP